MAWLIDARRYDDDWWSGLSFGAREIWYVCLSGTFRTILPGLCKGVSIYTLHDAIARRIKRKDKKPTIADVEQDLAEALQPDESGQRHFLLDHDTRVARIPNAPAYNHADGPNVLTAWYRAWRDVPDCDLKFDHIQSLRLGVNFSYLDKHRRLSMAEKWEATFGQPEKALKTGKKLKTYVELREQWVPTQGTLPYTRPEPPSVTPPVTLHSPSGSGIRDQGSGSGNKGVPYTHPVTPSLVVNQSPQPVDISENQSEPTASSNGGVDNGAGVPGFGPHGVAGGEGGRAGVASAGGSGGRRSTTPTPGPLSAPRRRLPRGLE